MQKLHTLPFELTADSVSDWLLSLDRLLPSEKANLLNGVLNELVTTPIDKRTVFLMLDKLTACVLLLSNLLEHNAQRPDYSPDKARKWMTAAIQLPKKLSFAYAQLAKDNAVPDTQQIVCAYRAMLILCLLHKRSTLFYEAQDLTIWKKFAELYLLAEEKQWLALKLEDRIAGTINYPTIDTLTKHALLFHASHPYRYETSAISGIFAATAELAKHAQLGTDSSDFALCHWQPDARLPPDCIDQENPTQRVFSLHTGDLADFFENHPDKSAKFEAYPGLLQRLTAYYESRRSVDPLHSQTFGLIIGSAQAEKFLNLLISRYRVMELSGMNQSHLKASHLELVPLEIRNTLASLSSKILADIKNVSANQLTVFPTKDRAFWVTKIGNLRCSQDEPAILVQEGKPPCFSLIRHIRPDRNIKLKTLLLERIEGEVYPVEIGKAQGFIVIRSDSEFADLFLPPSSRHGNSTVLAIGRGIIDASLKIEKFIESNMHFSRYQVSFLVSEAEA
ncbi:MAG: hypothetical protein ACR65R_18700 [Methylomicrobium sp.]